MALVGAFEHVALVASGRLLCEETREGGFRGRLEKQNEARARSHDWRLAACCGPWAQGLLLT